MAAFRGLGHIALKCHDLDRSVAFYEKLGFPKFLTLLNHDGKPWIVYLRFTDDLFLELFPGGAEEQVQTRGKTGLDHLSLSVDDLDVTEAHLKSVGIPLLSPRKDQRGVDGNRGMWIVDPDGHQIEIMEMAPDCIQYQAIAALKRGEAALVLDLPPTPRPKA
jgi:catechol 2,3-dioxygenase-like lactoylglutathione lyase family enzyme